MKLLLDNDLSVPLAEGLAPILMASHGVEVAHVRDAYPGMRWDAVWQRLSVDGWTLMKGDGEARHQPHRLDVIRRSNASIVFLAPRIWRTPVHQQAGTVLLRWEVIAAALGMCPLCLFDGRAAAPLAVGGHSATAAGAPGFRRASGA